jgi:O-antigen/teichoic acid export membrane protein
MDNTQGSSFLKSILKFSIASWARAGLAFISVPIITRAFTPHEYGRINIFNLSVTLISLLFGLSLDQSYIRYFKNVDSNNSRKKMLSQLVTITLISYLLFLVADFILGEQLSMYLFNEYNRIVIYLVLPVAVLMTILVSYQSIYFRMSEKALGFGILSIATVLATDTCMVMAAFVRPNYTTATILIMFGLLSVVIGCRIVSPESFKIILRPINFEQIKPYVKYSFPLVPVSLIGYLNIAAVRFILKDYFSYDAVGIFSVSVSLAGILSIVQNGFRMYWTPFMYSKYKSELALIKRIHSVVSFLMVAFSLLIILSSDIIYLILGAKFRVGRGIFGFLLITPVAYTIAETTCYGIYINYKTHLQFYSTAFSFLVSLVLGLILIPRYGILGAAISNAIGGIVFFLSVTYFGTREYNTTEKIYRTYGTLSILLLAGIINYSIENPLVRDFIIIGFLLVTLFVYKDLLGDFKILFKTILLRRKEIISGV